MNPDMLLPQILANILMLARAVQGEGCLGMVEPQECATWLVHCALYRSMQPWWHEGVEAETETAFHGTRLVENPSAQAITLTWHALLEPKLIHDLPFMVSEKDYQDHPEWDRELIVKSFYNTEGDAALHFLKVSLWK